MLILLWQGTGRVAPGGAWGIQRTDSCHDEEGLLDVLESSWEGEQGLSYNEEGSPILELFKEIRGGILVDSSKVGWLFDFFELVLFEVEFSLFVDAGSLKAMGKELKKIEPPFFEGHKSLSSTGLFHIDMQLLEMHQGKSNQQEGCRASWLSTHRRRKDITHCALSALPTWTPSPLVSTSSLRDTGLRRLPWLPSSFCDVAALGAQRPFHLAAPLSEGACTLDPVLTHAPLCSDAALHAVLPVQLAKETPHAYCHALISTPACKACPLAHAASPASRCSGHLFFAQPRISARVGEKLQRKVPKRAGEATDAPKRGDQGLAWFLSKRQRSPRGSSP
ncbi:hypothetical protein L7F22_024625 [Adiantum nelumboides]|nr:hypothetical protein [Adiantum nelumboides]